MGLSEETHYASHSFAHTVTKGYHAFRDAPLRTQLCIAAVPIDFSLLSVREIYGGDSPIVHTILASSPSFLPVIYLARAFEFFGTDKYASAMRATSLALIGEFAQALHVIQGTGDVRDAIAGVLGGATAAGFAYLEDRFTQPRPSPSGSPHQTEYR